MSRIQNRFQSLRAQDRRALIPYITAGDPHPRYTVDLMHAMVEGGADLIELGVPFSDPMADGPVVQLACERALAHNTSLWQVIDMVAEFRHTDTETPVVLMGYLNPIEARGVEAFAQRAGAAGVDGVLVVDLAVEEAPEFAPAIRAQGLDAIFLIAPTSTESRVRAVAELASGYLYYVSLKGVTGSHRLDVEAVGKRVSEIRAWAELPIAVGFGVRDAATVAAVGMVADGVVVGSALVSLIADGQGAPEQLPNRLRDKLAELRGALDRLT